MRRQRCSVLVTSQEEGIMLDLIFILLGVGGFALLGAYAALCNGL